MHNCEFDLIKVCDDIMSWHDSKLGWVSQKVNYCPICGWCKAFANVILKQNINDGI